MFPARTRTEIDAILDAQEKRIAALEARVTKLESEVAKHIHHYYPLATGLPVGPTPVDAVSKTRLGGA